MQCQDIRTKLSAFFDGESPAEEKNEIEQHLSICQECQAELAAFRNLSEVARDAIKFDPAEEYWASLPRRITARLPQKKTQPFSWSLRLLPVNIRFVSWIISLSAVSVLLFVVGKDVFREKELAFQTNATADSGQTHSIVNSPGMMMQAGESAKRIEFSAPIPQAENPKGLPSPFKVAESASSRQAKAGQKMEGSSGALEEDEAALQESSLSVQQMVSSVVLSTDSLSLQPRHQQAHEAQLIAEASRGEQTRNTSRPTNYAITPGPPGEGKGVNSFLSNSGAKKSAFTEAKSNPPSTKWSLANDVKPATGLQERGEQARDTLAGEALRPSLADTISALYRLAELASSGALDKKDATSDLSALLPDRNEESATDKSGGAAEAAAVNEIKREQILEAAELYYRLAIIDSLASLHPLALMFFQRQEKVLTDSLGRELYQQRLQLLMQKRQVGDFDLR